MIYLDNSATTRIAPEVQEAMQPYLGDEFGNASSIYSLGTKARVAIEDARAMIASFIGADARELVFTSGGTEANNMAIKGVIFQRILEGQAFPALSILTSPLEHHSVLHPIEFLNGLGVQTDYASPEENGDFLEAFFLQNLELSPTLISMMMSNNEVGSRTDIGRLSKLRKENSPNSIFHTDAVQALIKERIDVRALGVDLLSLSAHKIHGPKGIGVLYIKSGLKLEPLLHGGAQERNRRGGTESVANAIGFAKAIELLDNNWSSRQQHIAILEKRLLAALAPIPTVVLNSLQTGSGLVNFTFTHNLLEKLDGEALLINFDLRGIAVSNGSACTSGSMQPSHVLLAMGKGEEVARKSIRVSISHENTASDIDSFIIALKAIIQQASI